MSTSNYAIVHVVMFKMTVSFSFTETWKLRGFSIKRNQWRFYVGALGTGPQILARSPKYFGNFFIETGKGIKLNGSNGVMI